MHRDALAAHARSDSSTIALATARHVEKLSLLPGALWPWIGERQALVEESQRLKNAGIALDLGVGYAWSDASYPS